MMKVGIDCQAAEGQGSGLGTYVRHLIHSLKAEQGHGLEMSFLSKDQKKDWNTPARLFWENWELPRLAKRSNLDLLHVPAFAAPRMKPCRMVMTVHDLIGSVFPNQMGWPSRFYWGKWLPATIRSADVVIADSESTKKDILRHRVSSEEKIRVVYPSGHENFDCLAPSRVIPVKQKLGIHEKYFIFVGTIEPRKNLLRVIEAFDQFQKIIKSGCRYQLVVVGSKEFAHGKAYEAVVEKAGSSIKDVLFTGYVSHEELNALYSGSEALVFPSLYEGFGIPVLEAMASGVPVITSNQSSLPEVAGDAAWMVDPCSVPQIAQGMKELTQDDVLRKELIEKGFRQIRKFSWKQTARQVIEIYQSVLN